MVEATLQKWQEANQRSLMEALGQVRARLKQIASPSGGLPDRRSSGSTRLTPASETAPAASDAPTALEQLCGLFGLSPFERDVLLLCAGIELDAAFGPLCAAAHNDSRQNYPTFGLALGVLDEAHWSALAPSSALRYWRLIDIGPGKSLTANRLRIDERVLHFLTGVGHLDEQLEGFVHPVIDEERSLVPSQREIAERIQAAWAHVSGSALLPVVQLCGNDRTGKRAVAAAVCEAFELRLYEMPAHIIPSGPHEFESLVRLWDREAMLGGSALLLDCDDLEQGDAERARLVDRFLESTGTVLLAACPDRRPARRRPAISFDVRKPTFEEQRVCWQEALKAFKPSLNGAAQRLANHFDLSETAIRSVGLQAWGEASAGDLAAANAKALNDRLWDACRTQARRQFGGSARRIEPAASWDDLVLPDAQRRILGEIALHIRQRSKVYYTWGFAAKSARGLGISALFSGPSGTGKTMAAEVLANELRLDLYHIDLSQVVSKYIGETEKNLARVFDAAEEGGAVLLFDEADALFGKRSEVKDSHDRYANIEIGYLLQRMESYRGLAILTTNLKDALDEAFQRRIRFMVTFPFPDARLRAEIWRHIFPSDTPQNGLDFDKLAQLNLPGGNIRNIALQAAFLAADAGEAVCMSHLLQAARSEYLKLERPLTDSEIRGWA